MRNVPETPSKHVPITIASDSDHESDDPPPKKAPRRRRTRPSKALTIPSPSADDTPSLGPLPRFKSGKHKGKVSVLSIFEPCS